MSSYLNTIGSFHNDHGIPVPIVKFSNDQGLKVYKAPNFSDEISGCIRPDDTAPAGFGIYVNGRHHPNRQRFTIAHELAHFFLHKDHIGDGIKDDFLYRSSLSTRIETEANKLAADILMPRKYLESDEFAHKSVSALADAFKVSESAMRIRKGLAY